MNRPITLTEVCLRDGSHVMNHQFTVQQVKHIAAALDHAGVHYIEVSHGDGLGGSTLQYGRSLVSELTLIEEAVSVCRNAKIAVLLIPGIGTVRDLKAARDVGASLVRVASHVTEADVTAEHIRVARELGMETCGFLMMAHMASVEETVIQALKMERYGAQAVYVTDSAGAMLPHEVKAVITALREALTIEIGFHGHNNLSLAVANTLVAVEAGATRIDGSVRCLGAGAGNAQTEVLVAVLDRLGMQLGINLYELQDLAEHTIAKLLPHSQEITTDSLIMGYAGVYSSFLLHAQRAATRFGLESRDVLVEVGKRKAVGGQEDLIMDVAAEMAKKKEALL
ncbi:4-hyroxy-2-oxovalerate/4-hydroxy-2-oxopentanoic acid aldolase [Fictibacillus macauensis ZFHKF-1]|uniref:4-hydroxy-2-oxovalerate aldolase n=1 Tax=Fictibacillus macauensis ZFHKF-1 TaxID=1196324 RepID=I8AK23_9BACL|nr:4-hydroxy-2-oxovalerate aldolase [Fictibacillus macauensis]EIT86167.1 4-hyroxy-2-oxovalerate/4-hydroxy-2-oxopentanoic acid aldolase [Fictibacillus macauensis ZFHKF-1]